MKEYELATVTDIQAALAAALGIKDELQLELDASKALKKPATERCLFLEMTPIEIRNQIYGLLLTNDSLSSLEAVFNNLPNRPHLNKFGLSPAILSTCRQIHSEATLVLYGSNTFILNCTSQYYGQTPIWRNLVMPRGDYDSRTRHAPKKYNCPGFAKIKHWKVILSTSDRQASFCPNPEFVYFCRALSIAPPQSLKVIIVPRGQMFDPPTEWPLRQATIAPPMRNSIHHAMVKVLRPLKLLRGLDLLEINEAEGADLPIYDPAPDMSLIKSNVIPSYLKAAIIATAQGAEPIQRVFQMYEKLVAYAKAYERNEDFKAEMEPPYGLVKVQSQNTGTYTSLGSWGFDEVSYGNYKRNPFKSNPQHPVEQALDDASIASEDDDLESFKNARAMVLKYLEPQYRRITNSAASMIEFIKYQKAPQRLFCLWQDVPEFISWYGMGESGRPEDACIDGIMLLEQYEKSFRRDMPLETQRNVRKHQRAFDLAYAKYPRGIFMNIASNELETYSTFWTGLEIFKSNFISAMDDMDHQYLEIRATRKVLFEHDTEDWGCELDLETWRCDEMVDWTINEPNLAPAKGENPPDIPEETQVVDGDSSGSSSSGPRCEDTQELVETWEADSESGESSSWETVVGDEEVDEDGDNPSEQSSGAVNLSINAHIATAHEAASTG